MNNISTAGEDGMRTLDQQSFGSMVLRGEGRIAVEFMSYGCGYCRAIEPFLHQVAQTLGAEETVYRVDITAEPELASSYRIAGTPTFVMFLNGSEVGRVEGPDPDIASITAALTEPFQ